MTSLRFLCAVGCPFFALTLSYFPLTGFFVVLSNFFDEFLANGSNLAQSIDLVLLTPFLAMGSVLRNTLTTLIGPIQGDRRLLYCLIDGRAVAVVVIGA